MLQNCAAGIAMALLVAGTAAPDELKPRTVMEGHTDEVYAVVFSPDGKTLASGGQDATVRLWEVATGKEKSVLLKPQKGKPLFRVYALVYSPDGKALASGGNEDVIRLWDVLTEKQQTSLQAVQN